MTDAPIVLSADGYTPLPRGKLASVVTSLEMRRPFPSATPGGRAVLRRVLEPDVDGYMRVAGASELAFFGLVPGAVGKGLGRAAMTETVARVATTSVERFWVHTCTLDHERALAFYMRSGFKPFARSIEVFDDPRLAGVLPRESAPRVPIID